MTRCGRIWFKRRKVYLSHVLSGQNVGVTQTRERIWLSSMRYDLGYFDGETIRIEAIDISSEQKCSAVVATQIARLTRAAHAAFDCLRLSTRRSSDTLTTRSPDAPPPAVTVVTNWRTLLK